MATFTNKTTATVGTTETSVYAPPSATKAIVIGCSISNTSDGFLPVDLFLRTSGPTDNYLLRQFRIGNGESFELMKGNKLVILPGQTLYAKCPVANAITFVISVLEGVA